MCKCCGNLRASGLALLPGDTPVELCGPCRQAECDGGAPCRVLTEYWTQSSYLRAAREALASVHEMERQLVASKDEDNRGETGSASRGKWLQVSAGYWRKEVVAQDGNLVCDVLKVDQMPGYQAQVRVIKAREDRLRGSAMYRLEAVSLLEAQADCDDMMREVLDGTLWIRDETDELRP